MKKQDLIKLSKDWTIAFLLVLFLLNFFRFFLMSLIYFRLFNKYLRVMIHVRFR